MGKRSLIFAVFSVIMGLLFFGIWSNIHVYAQQQSSPQPRKATADSLDTTTKISPEIKAKMCNPGNPSLKVVNATESRICGIPRTVKPHTSSAATPPTSSVSSSVPQQTTTTTKPKSVTSVSHPSATTKQQQITNNNTNSISRTVPTTGATMTPDRSLGSSLSSSPSSIAPQVKAINQQQRQQQPPITPINSTTASDATTSRQNYTLSTSTTPPSVTSGKTMYLGYHSEKSNPSNRGSSSTDKTEDSANPKSASHSTRSTTAVDNGSTTRKSRSISTDNTNGDSSSTDVTNRHHAKLSTAVDNGSTGKKNKNTDTTKIDTTPTTNRESASELASAIKNKVDSIIRNSISGIIHKTPFLLPFH